MSLPEPVNEPFVVVIPTEAPRSDPVADRVPTTVVIPVDELDRLPLPLRLLTTDEVPVVDPVNDPLADICPEIVAVPKEVPLIFVDEVLEKLP
jgi:hypothetical protein